MYSTFVVVRDLPPQKEVGKISSEYEVERVEGGVCCRLVVSRARGHNLQKNERVSALSVSQSTRRRRQGGARAAPRRATIFGSVLFYFFVAGRRFRELSAVGLEYCSRAGPRASCLAFAQWFSITSGLV